MTQTYPIEIFYSEEDAGYIATFPDLPGCSAFGESENDALSARSEQTNDLDACKLLREGES